MHALSDYDLTWVWYCGVHTMQKVNQNECNPSKKPILLSAVVLVVVGLQCRQSFWGPPNGSILGQPHHTVH